MIKKGFITFGFLLVFLFVGNSYLVPSANAQACTAPVTPSGVMVDYPSSNNGVDDLTKADCIWNLQGDAASYNVTVTEVETGTIIKNNESQSGSTTKVTFPVTQMRQYKCDVVAVAACGATSAAASDTELCDADAIIDNPTPTPTTPPASQPQIPPKAATPTIASPGGMLETVGIVGGVVVAIFAGIMLFVL